MRSEFVEAFHAEFPDLTYDVTIKIEHLLKHRDAMPVKARNGRAAFFITSAVESLDDPVLARLAEVGHTARRFCGRRSRSPSRMV